ncbi:IclR family transcriptional regulator [Humibacter antri]
MGELAMAADLAPATTHRLLQTLVTHGYARRLEGGRYALGGRLVRLGGAAGRACGEAAGDSLTALAAQLDECTSMAMLDGDVVVYVAQAASTHSMRMSAVVGRRDHAHVTGVGKALLACLTDDRVRDIVARAGLPRHTASSHTTVDALLLDLQATRVRGYAITDGEQELGMRCYAVAVPHAPTPTAISVSGPATRIDDAFGRRAIPLLRDTATWIASQMRAAT